MMTTREQHLRLRLLVELPRVASETSGDLEADAGAALGPGWTVARLFPHSADPALVRHWVVTGDVPVSPGHSPAPLGYDLAAALAQRTGCAVEPDLASSAFGPEPGADVAAAEVAGPGPVRHLPGSAAKDWALDSIRVKQAWERALPAGGSARGRGVLIGHIDTGYSDHPDLERSALDLTRDLDVVDDDDDARDPLTRRWWWPLDSPGHGTLTGSVIASRVGRDIVGAAPEATLLPVRAVRSVVQVFDADVARAVDHARRSGCHVITMSLGGRGFAGLQDVIRRAVADGIIVMAAAGNQVGFVVAPAVYPECLAVAATNADDRPWAGSSRGPAVDISAPGESVWVARVDSSVRPVRFGTDRSSGTSFAVAHLAGVAALWLAFHGPATIRARYGPDRVQDVFLGLVRGTCRTPTRWDGQRYGPGIVDADALLAAGLPAQAPELRPAASPLGPLQRITSALPGLPSAAVVARLATWFGTDEASLPGLLRPHASELVYLLGEHPELARVLPPPGRAAPRLAADVAGIAGVPAGAGAAGARQATWPEMSRHLTAALAGASP